MKALFRCSCIKNVYFRYDMSPIELEITYINTETEAWISRKSVDAMSNKNYIIRRYEKAYNDIKIALLNKQPFVEIEL